MGISHISCIIIEKGDEQTQRLTLSENLSHQDLLDFEIGMAIIPLLDKYEGKSELAKHLGITRGQLYRYEAYSKLDDEILDYLDQHKDLLCSSAVKELVAIIDEHKLTADDVISSLTLLADGKLTQKTFTTNLVPKKKTIKNPKPQAIKLSVAGVSVGGAKKKGKKWVIEVDDKTR